MHRLLCTGVDKTQLTGVQTLPCKAFARALASIHHIPKKGMADAFHVHSDLMCAPGFKHAAYVGKLLISGNYLIMRYGRAGILCCDRHTLSVCAVAPYRSIDRSGVSPYAPIDDSFIRAREAVIRQLRGEALMRKVIFCGDYQAGRVHIYTVHDPGAALTAYSGEAVSAVPEQRVDKCAIAVAGGGVYDHASGLVDDYQIIVFIDHIKRDI